MSLCRYSSTRTARRALTYLEVLIAAAIGLVGTLGAVALFPVAILQLHRGLEADAANAVGEAAVHTAQTIGISDPRKWLFQDPNASIPWSWVQLYDHNTTIDNGQTYAANPPDTRASYGNRNWHKRILPFSSFCFDPRFLAEFDTANNTSVNGSGTMAAEYWQFPHTLQQNVNGSKNNDARMWRVSLWNQSYNGYVALTQPFSLLQARLVFKSSDDLIFNRDAKDQFGPLPAAQSYMQYNASGSTVQERRDYRAEYEWIATLVPKYNGAAGAEVLTGEYTLSIVVFHNRQPRLERVIENSINTGIANNSSDNFAEAERVVDVNQFYSNGIGGGDVELRSRIGRPEADLFVRENEWVMLGGMLYQNSGGAPTALAPTFQWYRVVSVQGDSVNTSTSAANPDTDANKQYAKVVTLQGGDWPAPTGTNSVYVQNTQATFLNGVVGVYERTIRLID